MENIFDMVFLDLGFEFYLKTLTFYLSSDYYKIKIKHKYERKNVIIMQKYYKWASFL